MQVEFVKANATLNFVAEKKPSITGATRLETQPTAVNLKTGLQAPLADPLWMLARQWQFNEFQGEDAGTPLKLSFAVDGSPVDFFRSGRDEQQPWQPIEAGGPPLEARVEAEAVWKTHPRRAAKPASRPCAWRLRRSPVGAPERVSAPADAPTDPEADQAGLLWATVLNERTVDAAQARHGLEAARRRCRHAHGSSRARWASPPATSKRPGRCSKPGSVWFDGLRCMKAGAAPGDNPSWQRNRMEYAFSLKAATWRSGPTNTRTATSIGKTSAQNRCRSDAPAVQHFAVPGRHPSPVRYPGMPAERYWEFEDGNVNFAGAEAGVTDLLRMTVIEFAVTFGNDWFVVPVRLPVGALYRVNGFAITDSFGIIAPAKEIVNLRATRRGRCSS